MIKFFFSNLFDRLLSWNLKMYLIIFVATKSRPDGDCYEASGKKKVHRYRKAIQYDCCFLGSVHDPWLDWSFRGYKTGSVSLLKKRHIKV